ncbi:hypothetical protein MLD52_09595 [Puniceicoccaceae bacterium K14]|nr:hypothetical protein [Puniceicoccaceae bacterium K14]
MSIDQFRYSTERPFHKMEWPFFFVHNNAIGFSTDMKTEHETPILPHPSLALGYSSKHQTNTIKRIRNAILIIANLIANGEEKLLPLFQRLEQELENQIEEKEALKRAIKICEQNF